MLNAKHPYVMGSVCCIPDSLHVEHQSGLSDVVMLCLLHPGLWGMSMAGADICGFSGDTTEELCARCGRAHLSLFWTFCTFLTVMAAGCQLFSAWLYGAWLRYADFNCL